MYLLLALRILRRRHTADGTVRTDDAGYGNGLATRTLRTQASISGTLGERTSCDRRPTAQ
jgi:hypothetical protein